MLVVDFMHKCELGMWKVLFTHLIRLLYALPGSDSLVACLDYRSAHETLLANLNVNTLNIDFATSCLMVTGSFANLLIIHCKES